MKVECAILTCRFNDKGDGKYGVCQYQPGIVLKWRLAADLGKGSLVLLECLNMELKGEEGNGNQDCKE